jgi:hypothetical protein
MADISAFPSITNVVVVEGHTKTYTGAGSVDIKPGMVVDYDSTGVSNTAQASLAVANDYPVGVAITNSDVSASETFTVMLDGIANLANADDTTAIDAGEWVMTNDNAVGGTVSVASIAGSATTLAIIQANVVGQALADIAGGGYGEVRIAPCTITRPNSS